MINKLIIGWVIDWLLKALLSAFSKKTDDPIEQLPEDHPDAKPSFTTAKKPRLIVKRKRKYQGIPGFDPDTGTWK